MPNAEIENAKINSTFIGFEDHGVFAVNVDMSGESWGQGTGCYSLTDPQWIANLLRVIKVNSWEDLPGKFVRVRRSNGYDIDAIGHLIEDRWFLTRKGEIEK